MLKSFSTNPPPEGRKYPKDTERGENMQETIYINSMGKRLKLTAIFDNDVDANKHMEKTDDAVVAVFGKYVLLANRYDKGI